MREQQVSNYIDFGYRRVVYVSFYFSRHMRICKYCKSLMTCWKLLENCTQIAVLSVEELRQLYNRNGVLAFNNEECCWNVLSYSILYHSVYIGVFI